MKQNIKQLIICIAFGLNTNASFAFEDGNIIYDVDTNNKAIVVGPINKDRAQYFIPDSVEYNNMKIPVVVIGKKAFYGCTLMASITLPNTLERIEESAFYNCGLRKIVLPNTVKTIGNNAFSLCSYLTKIQLSSTLASIGRSAFSFCEQLDSIIIPSSVTDIAKSTFANCKRLSSLMVESGNTIYDSRDGCNAIIQKQGNILVAGCKNTIIPEGITSIGENAFYGSRFGENLEKIYLPSSLTTISGSAFYNCKISSIVIPNAVESIGDNAFSLCSDLIKIEFSSSSSLLSIGRSAFSYCEELDDITIPKSVLTIGKTVFANCKSLSRIQVETGNAFYTSPDNCNAILQGEKLIVGCSGTDISKSGATSIGEGAFYGSGFGGDVVIPSSIKAIEEQGLYNCDNLKSVTIEEGLITMGQYAFSLCSNLETVQLPSSLKRIDKYAFHYCDNLREITSLIQSPFVIDNSVFDGLFTTATLRVPTGTKTAYKQTSGWNFSTIEEFELSGMASPTIAAIRIYSNNGVLYVESAMSGNCRIYSTSGQLIRNVALKQGVNTVEGLSKGLYIVNGQKIMVR